jgi:single-strand DNA-binding protein
MANDINYTILVGRLTRDEELSYLQSGTAVGKISLANGSRRKKGEEWVDETSFFDITLFGKSAESLKPYLVKGQQIAVACHLKQDRWEKDGQKFSKISILADTVQLLGGKKDGGGSTPQPQAEAPVSADDYPEDIPF